MDLESIFKAAHLQLKPRTPVPDIRAEFFPFAGLNHTARFREQRLFIRVSDLFRDAPAEIVHALAMILLSKLYRKKVDGSHQWTYRTFILGADIQQRARAARTERGRTPRRLNASGRYRHLDPCFERLNLKYFGGTLNKPRLSWSEKRSKRILGRYDMTRDTIFISRLFDAPSVPSFMLDYVMFHEMLHVKHQSRVKDCRVQVHTPEFRLDERTFEQYDDARLWLKKM